jgi:hypothetical protein
MIYRFAGGSSPAEEPWPCLPCHGGEVQWGLPVIGAPHASCPVSGVDTVASQGGKVVLPWQLPNKKARHQAQSSKQCCKVVVEVTGRGMLHVYRPTPSSTVEGSSQDAGPKTKFKQ